MLNEDDHYETFDMTVRDAFGLILWTSLGTLCVVGLILAVAI
jgi:hypothetical protein